MTKNLIAKPVVENSYWVVTDGQNKVGNVIASNNGFNVILGNNIQYCANTADIMRNYSIEFERSKKKSLQSSVPWKISATSKSKTYNNMFDVRRKLHLYTKSAISKCYYVSGYFAIDVYGEWNVFECPKYIFVQRYNYSGPYDTKEQALAWVESTKQKADK